MGGPGSGDWYKWNSKTTTESQYGIYIWWLKKHVCLQPTTGTLSWPRGNNQTSSIGFRIETDRMVLNYRHRSRGGEWENVEQVVLFDRTSCNYGGHRTWFLCPLCRRRVAVLYRGGKFFLCRHCYDLTYTSQQESRSDRLMRKARKIRARLGASNNLMKPILFKPKNMHQKTFDRLRREADHASNLSMIIIAQRLGINIGQKRGAF